MTKYREILRLSGLGLSQQNIADSCNVSKKTVNRVLKRARELDISWPLDENDTDAVLAEKFFPSANQVTSNKRMPNYDYIHKELLRNGVSKKLLWTEYMEDCRANGDEALMYSQFCYHIQQDEQKRRATMHISRKPGEQVEVDWAGDPSTIIDPDTGEILKAYIFVGVMTYSQYAYVEAFLDMKQKSWIWTLQGLKGTTVKLWQNIPIRCFSFWMNGCFLNQLIQSRKISLNFFIGDARNPQLSSVHSMYSKNGTISLVVKTVR